MPEFSQGAGIRGSTSTRSGVRRTASSFCATLIESWCRPADQLIDPATGSLCAFDETPHRRVIAGDRLRHEGRREDQAVGDRVCGVVNGPRQERPAGRPRPRGRCSRISRSLASCSNRDFHGPRSDWKRFSAHSSRGIGHCSAPPWNHVATGRSISRRSMTCVKPKSIRRLAEFKHEVRHLRGARKFRGYQGQKLDLAAVIVIEAHRMV